MKKIFFLLLIILFLIFLPILLNVININVTTELERAFINIFLTITSIWFGYSFDIEMKKKNEKETISEKWLPAALNSCLGLITMSAESKRLKESHEKACEMIDETFKFSDNEQLTNIKAAFKIQCNSCAAKMESIMHNVNNSINQWEIFIDKSCKKHECKYMNAKIQKRKSELGLLPQNEKEEYDCIK